jgi:phosphoadenosine phosphosulfate reductase
VVEAGGRHVKVNPLANWGKAELDAYVAEHDLPAHPLVAMGFPSIGCWPCTKPAEEGSDNVRAGRWSGMEKTECGIHVSRIDKSPADIGGE